MKIRIIILTILVIFLQSCISIDTEIMIKSDNSGEISITYLIAKNAFYIGKIDRDDNFFPLPVEEKKFREMSDRIDNLDLKSYKMTETHDQVIIAVKFSFNDIESLNHIMAGTADSGINIDNTGTQTVYTQTIYNPEYDITAETIEIIQSLYSSNYISFKVTAPSRVLESNPGSSDGKKAYTSISLSELLSSKEPVVWNIIW